MFSNINTPQSIPISLIFCLLLLFDFSGVTVANGSQSDLKEPHDFRAYGMNCRSCHKTIGISRSGGMVKPVREICNGCHTLEGLLSHPVDIKPAFALPADLPLDDKGMMTCTTCHNPHKTYKNFITGKKTMYLRRDGPQKAFCMACHAKA